MGFKLYLFSIISLLNEYIDELFRSHVPRFEVNRLRVNSKRITQSFTNQFLFF